MRLMTSKLRVNHWVIKLWVNCPIFDELFMKLIGVYICGPYRLNYFWTRASDIINYHYKYNTFTLKGKYIDSCIIFCFALVSRP